MVGVQFKGFGQGRCSWCQKERSEVYYFALADNSFSGGMCWNDLKCFVRLKVLSKNRAVQELPNQTVPEKAERPQPVQS